MLLNSRYIMLRTCALPNKSLPSFLCAFTSLYRTVINIYNKHYRFISLNIHFYRKILKTTTHRLYIYIFLQIVDSLKNWHMITASLWYLSIIYDRLRSASELKSASTHQIGIHWRHYLKSRSDWRVFSNRRPFQIIICMSDLLVRVYVSDVIVRRFEKVKKDIDFRIVRRFENLIKGHRSEVQMSVM